MPNHCTNTLVLKGEYSHRQEFVDKNRGFGMWDTAKEKEYSALSFHAQVPCPKKHISKHKGNPSESGWYSWCLKHWGTKWDCYEESVEHHERYTVYSFDTAWSPPVDWIKNVSKKFPHIMFENTWAEEGGEGGEFHFQGGDCFHDKMMSDEEWKDYMGYEDDEE